MSILRSVYSLFFRVFGLVGGFLSVVAISRWLSPTEAGLFFSMVATLVAFALFSRLGQDKSLIPDIVNSNGDDDVMAKALSISFYPYLFFSGLWFILFDFKYAWLIVILYLMIFNHLISSYFKAKFKANLSILFENSFIYSILFFVLNIIYFFKGGELAFKDVLYSYTYSVIFQFLLVIFYKKGWILKVFKNISFLHIKDFFKSFLKLRDFIIISYFGHLLRFLPILIIMIYLTLEDLSSYKVIEQVSMSSGVIIVAVNSIYSAYYVKYKNEVYWLRKILVQSFNISLMLACLFFIFLNIIVEHIFIYATIDYLKYRDIFFIFMIANFFSILSAPLYNALIMIGKENKSVVILYISSLSSVLVMYYSIVEKSLFWLSFSHLVFYIFQFIFSLYFFVKGQKLDGQKLDGVR